MRVLLYLLIFIVTSCASSVKKDMHGRFEESRQVVSNDDFYQSRVFSTLFNEHDKEILMPFYKQCNKGDLSVTRKMLDYFHASKRKDLALVYFLVANCNFLHGKYLKANHFYSLSLGSKDLNDNLKNLINNNLALMYILNGHSGMGQKHLELVTLPELQVVRLYNDAIRNMVLGNYINAKATLYTLNKENNDSKIVKRLILFSSLMLGELNDREISKLAIDSDFKKFYQQYKTFYFYDYEKFKKINENKLQLGDLESTIIDEVDDK